MSSVTRPAWAIGDELEEQTISPVSRMQLIKYAGASGDFNPIHSIDAAATAAGLSGVIAHGMLTMATIERLFSPYLSQGFVKEYAVRFMGMVFVGDELIIGGRAVGKEATPEGETHTFEVYARKDEDEKPVAAGTVSFLVFE